MVVSGIDKTARRFEVVLVFTVYASPILQAYIIALLIEAVGVNDLEKEAHEPLYCLFAKLNANALCVSVIGASSGMACAICPARFSSRHTRQMPEELLHPPQAAASEIDFFDF